MTDMEDELTNDNIMKAFGLLEFTDEPVTSEEKKGVPEGRFTVDKKRKFARKQEILTILSISKIQLVVYYQCCLLIG